MNFDEVGLMYACLWKELGFKRFSGEFVDQRSFQSEKRCDVFADFSVPQITIVR